MSAARCAGPRWAWVLALGACNMAAGAADGPRFSHSAALALERPAAFIELALPVAVLGASRRADLADLRLEDARGQVLPFAWLPPRRPSGETPERFVSATLYAWPRTAQADALPESVRVVTRGARIEVQAGPVRAGAPLAGWLVDTGARAPDDPRPLALQLDWPSSSAPFTAAYALTTSDDLRSWRGAGGGHLLALAGPGGGAPLKQTRVPLPADAGRFVRLIWLDAAGAAPPLSAARSVLAQPAAAVEDPRLRLELQPLPPSGVAAPAVRAPAARQADDAAEAARAARSLVVDLGAVLELRQLQVGLAGGNRVVPVTVQWRSASDQAWSDAAHTVLYRLERPGGVVDVPPPLALAGRARQLRLVPDERAGSLVDAAAAVTVDAMQPRLVFVAQGQPPYQLRVGNAQADSKALAVVQLVPRLEDERPRLGRAVVGTLQLDEQVQAAELRERQWARWRPVALWAVLIGGVAGLGAMVWRLARAA